jgi:peptidyl-prolyl cis-trans isomerase C
MALGAALFGLHRWVAPSAPSRHIVVSAALIQGLRQDYLRRNGRLPTAAEEDGLVDRYVDDEVRYREALVLGLDRGDVIVRRRMVQKMQYLTEDTEPVPPPTEAELQAYVDAHPARYAVPERVSLTHVFAANERRGDAATTVAAAWQAALAAGAAPTALGDPFLRGQEFTLASEDELAGVFGPEFAAAVMALPVGQWSAPLRSSYGVHVVRLSERRGGTPASLAGVRDRVMRDWQEERREALDRAALARLRARYDLRIERPPDSPP